MSVYVANVDVKKFNNYFVVFLYVADSEFVDNPRSKRQRKFGSVKLVETASEEEARKYQKTYLQQHPAGECLENWKWGDVDPVATQKYHNSRPDKFFVTIHHIIKDQY